MNVQFREVMKVDKKTNPDSCGLKIVAKLRIVFFGKGCDGLDFHNQFFIADKVRDVVVFNLLSFIEDAEAGFLLKWDFPVKKLSSKAVLVDIFKKTGAENTMDFHECAANRVGFGGI